ncbi:sigma-70 family RNA polymerase sigma factor [Luteimonas marina]|uniref:Sigma-70 family RNA polymerase sigma factor n=1 Tax=Luteimonas marina TaxID=488485 RepID=A0A5C5TZW6_9GAMM|nr:sigma-70 family RNA polymerase sigma factor [Luteimonas marina]TWT19099.1 sigma-70 family RNA polymerase sigma factor [Luteimonas marina]
MHEHAPPREREYDLVRKARWGNEAAFAELYRLHARAVYTLAYRLTASTDRAEDITQDTFLRMLRFLPGFRAGTPLRPWLKKVAANAAIDLMRRDRHVLDDALIESAPSGAEGADASMDAEGLLRRMPPLARTLFWLHEIEGWSHQELARRFGQSPSWSKSIVSRALARLRVELEQGEPG